MKKPKFKTYAAPSTKYDAVWWSNHLNDLAGGYAFKLCTDAKRLNPGSRVWVKHSGGCGDSFIAKLSTKGIKCPECKNASFDPEMGDGHVQILEVKY